MKKIWKLLKQHVAADFNWKLYLSIGIFLVVIIAINYRFNFENGIIDKDTGRPVRILWYFLEVTFVYFVSTVIVFYFNNSFHFFKSSRYWLIVGVTLLVLSIDLGFPYTQRIATALAGQPYSMFRWTYGIVNNSISFLLETFPLLVLAYFFERQRENFGVNNKNIDLSPYWQILMFVLPLVIVASFESGFRNYYPVYKRYEVATAQNPTDLPGWLFGLGFETAYGLDFFNVEFVFRGALIVGVSQVIGKESILPMVAVYCALHFGKPIGECISSIFGGYVLGVVAFYTRNIWGGVIVHIGLAWMMEIAALIQRGLT